jgi:hypothetical protein
MKRSDVIVFLIASGENRGRGFRRDKGIRIKDKGRERDRAGTICVFVICALPKSETVQMVRSFEKPHGRLPRRLQFRARRGITMTGSIFRSFLR